MDYTIIKRLYKILCRKYNMKLRTTFLFIYTKPGRKHYANQSSLPSNQVTISLKQQSTLQLSLQIDQSIEFIYSDLSVLSTSCTTDILTRSVAYTGFHLGGGVLRSERGREPSPKKIFKMVFTQVSFNHSTAYKSDLIHS